LFFMYSSPGPVVIDLIPLPPSPGREGGMNLNINVIAPLPWERGWGEVKEREGDPRG
jgi:hypothetical protein